MDNFFNDYEIELSKEFIDNGFIIKKTNNTNALNFQLSNHSWGSGYGYRKTNYHHGSSRHFQYIRDWDEFLEIPNPWRSYGIICIPWKSCAFPWFSSLLASF